MRYRRNCTFGACLLALIGNIPTHAAESAHYLGGAVGAAGLRFHGSDFSVQGTVPEVSRSTTDTGYKLFAGYRLGTHIAAELAYTDFGRYRYDMRATTGAIYKDYVHRFRYRTSAWSISLKGDWPLTSRWNVFGRIGATWNRATNDYAIDDDGHVEPPLPPDYVAPPLSASHVYGEPGHHTSNAVVPLWGVGIAYRIFNNARLRLEYEDHGRFGSKSATGRARLAFTSLALEYSF